MTEQPRYIAAIEIGSSKIIGAVGKIGNNGKLSIVAVEREECSSCVNRGIIQNLEEVSSHIDSILDKLEYRTSVAPRKITGVFVGISGLSLRSIASEALRELPDDTEITEDIISTLRSEAKRKPIDHSLEIVDAVPRTFFINNKETANPIGMVGNNIRTTYDLIACQPVLRRNITRVIEEKVKIALSGFVVTPLAVGHLILTSEEKRLGCMLVDLGAETTTVSLYKNGELCYLASIPLGGRNITRDITTLGILEEKAEEIKINSGNALPQEKPSTLNLDGVKLSDVANLITARAEEIVANIYEQIAYAGLKDDDLPGGIVVLGGGFNLHGMVELLQKHCNIDVRRARLPENVDLEDTRAPMSDTIEVISILYSGATFTKKECLEYPAKELPDDDHTNNPDIPGSNTEVTTGTTTNTSRPGRFGKLLTRISKSLSGAFNPDIEDEDTEII